MHFWCVHACMDGGRDGSIARALIIVVCLCDLVGEETQVDQIVRDDVS